MRESCLLGCDARFFLFYSALFQNLIDRPGESHGFLWIVGVMTMTHPASNLIEGDPGGDLRGGEGAYLTQGEAQVLGDPEEN